MKVYVKIYKFCDADFYAINGAGISVASLMKLALMYRAAGKDLHIFIPQCLPYDVAGLKRCVPLEITVTDPASIRFLKKEIKPRQRTAFLKAILRQALMDQMTGVFLKNDRTISAENRRIAVRDLDGLTDVLFLRPGTLKRDYASLVEKRTLELSVPVSKHDEDDAGRPKTRNRFGDVGDLAIKKRNKSGKKKIEKAEKKNRAADDMPVAGTSRNDLPEDGFDFADEENENTAEQKENISAEEIDPGYDMQDDLFGQFESL